MGAGMHVSREMMTGGSSDIPNIGKTTFTCRTLTYVAQAASPHGQAGREAAARAQQRELSGKRDITTEDETHSEWWPCDRSSSGNSR